MKITFLTPGTGSYYCGACMRDNALARSLHRAGHQVSLLPMYLPLRLEEDTPPVGRPAPMFFGGANLWLQQHFPIFRHTPAWFDRMLDHPALLTKLARHSHMTSAADHADMTMAMLRVEQSRFRKEFEKLINWLAADKPDLLCLSTALQAGMTRELKQHLGTRVICHFQGEDGFLDSLPQPARDACWNEMAKRVADADVRVAPSRFYADYMTRRLGTACGTIEVLPNGIDPSQFPSADPPPGPPVIGFLARMIPEKGLGVLVDAFLHLRRELRHPDALLHIAGAATPGDAPLISKLRHRLDEAGLADAVRWSFNLSREEKTEMLSSLTLFSVPAVYQEAFGLYVIEAMACGVPVVQPDASSFLEIVGETGSGLLVPAGDPVALGRAWLELLDNPALRRQFGANGVAATRGRFSLDTMRDRFLDIAMDTRP